MWLLWVLAAPAFVAVWAGWVALGTLTGFGMVQPLPGIADGLWIDTRVLLPVGVEAYAALSLRAWLDQDAPARARTFAAWSSIGALLLGAAGQVTVHLMTAAGVTTAPWPVTAVVACLPVLVLGMGAALAHLLHTPATELDQAHVVDQADLDDQAPVVTTGAARRAPTGPTRQQAGRRPTTAGASGSGASGSDTRDRVAALVEARPGLTAADVAAEVGVSARTARRHLAEVRAATRPASGAPEAVTPTTDDSTDEDSTGAEGAGQVDELRLARERTTA
ncbi:MAG: hypothetical protein ACRCTR_09655 [Actinomycetota bacterium]